MVSTVKQSAVDALSLLSQVLPMAPDAAIQEVAVALNSRIDQQAQDISTNQTLIQELQVQVAELPNLQEAERQEVLSLIQENLPNLDLSFNINYLGEPVDGQIFLQMIADQQAAKPVAVDEVQRTDGYVTSAKVLMSDASEQTITFERTTSDDGTIATYIGRISDGAGGVVDGYQMKFNVSQLSVAGLSLTKTWDQDLISHRLFATGLSIEFEAVTPASTGDAPDTLGTA
ncbi:hypothetical protein [Leptothoe spongobia]|uniref:Uncharacterized protein n=1 Tax=Leptothoe spongobia TAU-MAC 1115 TaxID=1967444 RepID=A0A947DIK1_9CYAN|nr:hypothetical protein [Leptothoe spongobia]MBT9317299.1 hypothetical protein [Leptothoe spongobia TAU-MAC 1115]